MKNSYYLFRLILNSALPWVCLIILLIYTYTFFTQLPYAGIRYNGSNARVTEVYGSPEYGSALRVGDELLKIGSIKNEDFQNNPYITFFANAQAGDKIPITFQRSSQILTITWEIPGFYTE